jgi:hypothetical protein
MDGLAYTLRSTPCVHNDLIGQKKDPVSMCSRQQPGNYDELPRPPQVSAER